MLVFSIQMEFFPMDTFLARAGIKGIKSLKLNVTCEATVCGTWYVVCGKWTSFDFHIISRCDSLRNSDTENI